jgi:hypothetical protein
MTDWNEAICGPARLLCGLGFLAAAKPKADGTNKKAESRDYFGVYRCMGLSPPQFASI